MSALQIHQPVGPMPPPLLTAAMRDHLIRGHRATLRRYRYLRDCALKASRARGDESSRESVRLTTAMARLAADIAELEAL